MLSLNIFIFTVLKVKFSVTYDVAFTVNVPGSEMIQPRIANNK